MIRRSGSPLSITLSLLLLFVLSLAPSAASGGQDGPRLDGVTSPEDFFGHVMGADRQLARWDRMVDYFRQLEQESDRVDTVELGDSTEGHPFLMLVISSPDNLANQDRLAEISRRLADPRGLSEAEVAALTAEGRAVVAQTLGLHSTEVAGCQSGVEVAYEFATRDDAEARRILDETVLLLMPCINPDGQVMITDWYRQTVGTEHEGSSLPTLYHRYGGHDNNRDGDYMNMAESEYIGRVLYRDWKPQAYVDHHQMGSYGARLYVPPYSEPIRPGADPLVWREISWYGAHIAYKLQEAGMQGVLNAAQYPGWGHFGWHWITPFHNMAGMLTESASATLATPLYIHPDQLRGGARGMPEYEAQSTMPDPWPGGWWRVRDIVDQQVVSAWALQDMAARSRETVLDNAAHKALRQIAAGHESETRNYVIPTDQHDPLTARHLVNTLLKSDLEILRAAEPFSVGLTTYAPGTFVVPAAQPKRGLVMNLLGRTLYPDNEWTRARDGSPLRPYDTSTHTMYEFMGVRVDAVPSAVVGDFDRVTASIAESGTVASGVSSWRLDGRENAAFRAVNLLIDAGAEVGRAHESGDGWLAGDFLVSADRAIVDEVATETGVDFHAGDAVVSAARQPMERLRVGMYQRYWGGNMDEGWTRLVLEQFDFPYESIMDEAIVAGDLIDSWDVIVLPHDSAGAITGEAVRRFGGRFVQPPEEYRSGIGEEGVEALREFVEAGGTLVTIGRSAEFAIETFELPLRDAVAGVDSTEFFCPGSTLRVEFDNEHPLAWGMPDEGYALFWDTPVLEIVPTSSNDDYTPVATYVDENVLQSGWLIGEEHLAGKAAMVAAERGEGQIVMIAARAQHRAQTDGTFKLLFNALVR